MLVVISPAKTLDFDTPATTAEYSQPGFLQQSAALIEKLRQLSPSQVSELMSISDKLGALNFGRYADWTLPFTPSNAKQAILAFKGDVYTGLEAESLSENDLRWAQDHLRILSGLYGLLRPLDLMQAYRLEMGTRFANSKGKNLYEFWGGELTEALNTVLQQQAKPVLINLASKEYFSSLQMKNIAATVITPVFKDWKKGKYKIISFYAKKARGMMSQHIIRNRIIDPEVLKQADMGGYSYNSAMSSPTEWVFLREQQV